jgi:hypothetical protein
MLIRVGYRLRSNKAGRDAMESLLWFELLLPGHVHGKALFFEIA